MKDNIVIFAIWSFMLLTKPQTAPSSTCYFDEYEYFIHSNGIPESSDTPLASTNLADNSIYYVRCKNDKLMLYKNMFLRYIPVICLAGSDPKIETSTVTDPLFNVSNFPCVDNKPRCVVPWNDRIELNTTGQANIKQFSTGPIPVKCKNSNEVFDVICGQDGLLDADLKSDQVIDEKCKVCRSGVVEGHNILEQNNSQFTATGPFMLEGRYFVQYNFTCSNGRVTYSLDGQQKTVKGQLHVHNVKTCTPLFNPKLVALKRLANDEIIVENMKVTLECIDIGYRYVQFEAECQADDSFKYWLFERELTAADIDNFCGEGTSTN